MKKLLFIILALLSIAASAQKIRFTDNKNRWGSHGTRSAEACPFATFFSYGVDTIINLRTYKRFADSAIATYYVSGCFGGGGSSLVPSPFLVREDTTTNIVYYIDLST